MLNDGLARLCPNTGKPVAQQTLSFYLFGYMRRNQFLLFVVAVLLTAFSNLACVRQNSTQAASEKNSALPALESAEQPLSVNLTTKQLETAKNLIEKSPDAALGYNILAAAYIRLARETGDFSINAKAESAALRALELEPTNLNSLKLKTSLMLTFHRFAEARDFARELQKHNSKDAFFYGALTDANIELGNYKEAVKNAQEMVDTRPDMASYARVSYVRSLHGEPDGAIEAMKLAAKIADPNDREAQAWCLVHLADEFFKTGKYRDAELQYDNALKTFSGYHLALAGKGRARAAQNDFDNAIKFLTEANARVPNVENIIFLADVYTRLNNLDEAKKQYELAAFIEKNLGNLDQRRLALLWADHDMKLDEALAIATREHDARKDIFTADIFAWCLFKNGKVVEAKKIIAEAMRLKTRDARFFYHAGMIERGLGNKKAATGFLRKALEINPFFDLLQAENAKRILAAN